MTDAKRIDEIKEKAYQLGFDYEVEYRGCGQCVIGALQEALGLKDDSVFKAASGFAGGIGLAGDSACGAYAGAVMILSTYKGREKDNFGDPEKVRFQSFRMAKRLHDLVLEEFGSVNCHAIHNHLYGRPFYLWDPDQMTKFDEAGGHTTGCPKVVGKVAELAVQVLDEEGLI